MNKWETGEGAGSMPEFNFSTLWRNPSMLIKTYKEMLKLKGESLAERIGECPLPIRINIPVPLSEAQIEMLGVNGIEGKVSALIGKESMFTMYAYGDKTTGEEHVAVIKDVGNGENVPIRIHSSCITSEVFHASNCDCHEQMEMALSIVEKEGFGGVIWLHQEGRGNGLAGKTKHLKIMVEEQVDTVEAFKRAGYPDEQRDYTIAVDILKDLGIKSVRLITNNPDKLAQVAKLGITVVDRIPCEIPTINEIVTKNLAAKRDKLGHLLGGNNS